MSDDDEPTSESPTPEEPAGEGEGEHGEDDEHGHEAGGVVAEAAEVVAEGTKAYAAAEEGDAGEAVESGVGAAGGAAETVVGVVGDEDQAKKTKKVVEGAEKGAEKGKELSKAVKEGDASSAVGAGVGAAGGVAGGIVGAVAGEEAAGKAGKVTEKAAKGAKQGVETVKHIKDGDVLGAVGSGLGAVGSGLGAAGAGIGTEDTAKALKRAGVVVGAAGEIAHTVHEMHERSHIRVIKAYLNNANDIRAHFHVVSITGQERISQLFEFEITVELEEANRVLEEDVLNLGATLEFQEDHADEILHTLYGMIVEMRDLMEQGASHPRLIFKFVSYAYPLSQYETLDIFLEQSVPTIVQTVLERSSMDAARFKIQDLVDRSGPPDSPSDYPEREFIVQYRETNLDFVSRLCEQDGVFYFFDTDGSMVFGDSNNAFTEVDRVEEAEFHNAGDHRPRDCVFSMEVHTRNLPKKYVVRDYNWRNPGQDVQGEAPVIETGIGTVVEYGAHVKNVDDATRVATIRAQELMSRRQVFSGRSNIPNLRAGSTFMLVGHPIGDQELLVTEVDHAYGPDEGQERYSNSFRAILKERPYRPARLTAKPRVSGSLTGVVQGGSGTDFGEIDEIGRYRIKFMFDSRQDANEAQASRAVRMAQPSAGPNQGMSFPLRANTEVILTFIDGDPDRPIIHGAVPNPQTASPTTAANQHTNVIQTSKNKIHIDDQDPRIKLTTEAYGTEIQLGSMNAPARGYNLKTAEDAVTTANKAIGSVTKLSSAFAEVASHYGYKNITSIAGPSKKWDLAGAAKFAVSAAEVVTSTLDGVPDVVGFVNSFGNADTDETGKAKSKAVADLVGENEKYPDPPPVRMVTDGDGTQQPVIESELAWALRRARENGVSEEDRQRLVETHNAHASAEARNKAIEKKTEHVKETIKPYAEIGKGAIEAVTAGHKIMETFGDAHRMIKKAQEVKDMVTAVAYAALAESVDTARVDHHPGVPQQPVHILGSSHTTFVYGDNVLLMGSRSDATLVGLTAGVVAKSRASLSSSLMTEVSAERINVTARAEMDTLVEGPMTVKIDGKVDSKLGDVANVVVQDLIKLESVDAGLVLKTKQHIQVDAKEGEFRSTAKAYSMEATDKDVMFLAKRNFMAGATDTVEMVGGDGVTDIEMSSSLIAARFDGSSGSGFEAKSGEAKLFTGSSTVKTKSSSVELSAGGSTLKMTSSAIDLAASKLNLG